MILIYLQIPWITKDSRLYFDRETLFAQSKLAQLSEWTDSLVQAAASCCKGNQQAYGKVSLSCHNVEFVLKV